MKNARYLDSVFLDPVRILNVADFIVLTALDPNDLLVSVGRAGEHDKTADHDVPLVTVAHVIWNMV
jgi:hypothetical protein